MFQIKLTSNFYGVATVTNAVWFGFATSTTWLLLFGCRWLVNAVALHSDTVHTHWVKCERNKSSHCMNVCFFQRKENQKHS